MIQEFHFNQSVVDVLSATDFFYPVVDYVTGEVRKNKNDLFRCLAIVERVASNRHKKKYLSSRALREIKYEYRPLLDILVEKNIILILSQATRKSATQVELNNVFCGSCSIELSKKEFNLVNIKFKKETRRGEKATTQKEIKINIPSYSKFVEIMLENGKDVNTISSQWLCIAKINKTGKINPRQKSGGRLYSNITSLSSCLHQYITIDGKYCVELDQHATYWTLLPNLLKATISLAHINIQENLFEDISKLNTFISNSRNIYRDIQNETNIKYEDIKTNSISFLCDPIKYTNNEIKKQIRQWFKTKFPHCSNHLDSLRKNNFVSYRIQEQESKIFISAGKELNKYGIDCIEKHDAILVSEEHSKTAETVLNHYFIKYNVPNKIRIKDYTKQNVHEIDVRSSHQSLDAPNVASNETDSNKVLLPLNIQENHSPENNQDRTSIRGTFQILKGSRKRGCSIISRPDGLFSVKYKQTKYYSKKSETKEQFKQRIEASFPSIIWS